MGSGECTGVSACKSGANPATLSPGMQTAYRVARDWRKGVIEAWKTGDTEGAKTLTENFKEYITAQYRHPETTFQERKLLLKLAESFFGKPSSTTSLPNIHGVSIAESDKELIIFLSYENPPPSAPRPAPTPPNSTQPHEEQAYILTPTGLKPPLGPEDIAELKGCMNNGACLVGSAEGRLDLGELERDPAIPEARKDRMEAMIRAVSPP